MGTIFHNVYFWLQNPESASDRGFFEASLKKLMTNSKYVETYHIGVPAATDRPVIDRSYTYVAVMSFANAADQDAYQVEEAHLTFLQESKHLWTKVVIYDSEEIK
ncbi:MAG: Dabb family protein [Bacteroidota bacterium]|nr:Dabb family protein [Bacteroidota bacterium]